MLHCSSGAAVVRPTETGGSVGGRALIFTMVHAWMSVWIPATRTLIVTANLDALEYLNMSKLLDVVGVVLLCGLAVVIFFIAQATTESNAVTTEVALLQAKEESRLVKEVRLLTLEMKNLQKDIDVIRDSLEIKKEKK